MGDAGHLRRLAQRWDWLTEACIATGDLEQAARYEARAHYARETARKAEFEAGRAFRFMAIALPQGSTQ